MSYYHNDNEGGCSSFDEDYDEILPFALNEEVAKEEMQPLHLQNEQTIHPECLAAVVHSSEPQGLPSMQSTFSQPPPLMSSMMTTDSTLASSTMSDVGANTAASSHWGGETAMLSSRHLDVAASLMVSMAGNGLQMTLSPPEPFAQPQSQQLKTSPHTPPVSQPQPSAYSRLGFSRLLQNAGDTSELITGASLPVLHEEEADSFHSAREGALSSFPSNISSTTSQIMNSDWIPVDNPGYTPPILDSTSSRTNRRQQRPPLERVSARQLDPTSFEVSIEIAPDLSIQAVMEVLGNPSYLVLWCESIRSLVVLNSSEGAASAEQQRNSSQRRANYEGEWIEASTTDLISPPSSSSCFYSTSKAMWNYVGFPSHYGNVSMFVERLKGRVGLSIGPFAGDVTVSHSIRVEKHPEGTARIVDRVTLSKDVTNGDLLCGVLACLESCFLPTMKGYMDQVAASMMRLRVLVETGEGSSQQEGFELIHARRQRAW